MVIILKIFCFAASFMSDILGLFLLVVITTYLWKKPEGQKTVLDLIIIDNLISAALYCFAITITMLLGIIGSMPYWVAVFIALPTYVLHNFLFVSVSVTFVINYLFIIKSEIMFGFSDTAIRRTSLSVKVILSSLYIFLDQWGQKNPPGFDFFDAEYDR